MTYWQADAKGADVEDWSRRDEIVAALTVVGAPAAVIEAGKAEAR